MKATEGSLSIPQGYAALWWVPALWKRVSAACVGMVSVIQVEEAGEERGGKMRHMLLTATGNKDSN